MNNSADAMPNPPKLFGEMGVASPEFANIICLLVDLQRNEYA